MSYCYVVGLQSEVNASKEKASTIKKGDYITVGVYDSDESREEPSIKVLKVTEVKTEGEGRYAITKVTVDLTYADCATIEFSVNETYRRAK